MEIKEHVTEQQLSHRVNQGEIKYYPEINENRYAT